ncbi:uncharacterized protein [Ptychodera flava]|uniref:uncharacterized protein n=1 Tax=Ptychodera flava TaxID=63121 RepID=UPI00396A153F
MGRRNAGQSEDKFDEFADDVNEFYEEKLSDHLEKVRNRTQEAVDSVFENVKDVAEKAQDLRDNVRPYIDHAANVTQTKLETIGDRVDDVTEDVGGWFDETFGDIFDSVANKTRSHLAVVFEDINNLFGGPYHGRRRRALVGVDGSDSASEEQRRGPTCEELNSDDTRGRACMKFTTKCSECAMLPERDCPGFAHSREAFINTLSDFRNATSVYKSVFEAFKEGQLEYHSGLHKLASRYKWISKFQQLPEHKRGYKVIKLNFNPDVDDDDPTDEFAPVEATVVMFGELPHTLVVEIPVNPWNYDIAGTMIAARALAWYSSQS